REGAAAFNLATANSVDMRWNYESARARMCRNLPIATEKTTKMKKINRRTFAKATGAFFALPAFAGFSTAMAQAPNNSDLLVDKDIAFGKGGDIDLLLDVYHPPQGVTPKRMAIIHLFGGGFSVGNKNAGYIVNDVRALGKLGYTNVSANYRLTGQGLWPSQI